MPFWLRRLLSSQIRNLELAVDTIREALDEMFA